MSKILSTTCYQQKIMLSRFCYVPRKSCIFAECQILVTKVVGFTFIVRALLSDLMHGTKEGWIAFSWEKKKEEKVKDAIHDLVEIRTNAIQCIDFAI